MRIRLLTLRFSSDLGIIDDRPLTDFVRDKRVLSVREHFFVCDGVPHLACLLTYHENAIRSADDGKATRNAEPSVRRRRPQEDLKDEERPLFQTLREWRTAASRKEGVPPYVIFTDRQLVELIRTRPASKNRLLEINGIGPAKVKRYGNDRLTFQRSNDPRVQLTSTIANASLWIPTQSAA